MSSELFQSLPYFDSLPDERSALQNEIEQLIAQEMRQSTKKLAEYKSEIDSRSPDFEFSKTTYFGSDFKELVQQNGQLPQRIDYTMKYKTTLPTVEDTTKQELEDYIAQAKASIMIETNRSTDLELLNKYNVAVWDISFQRADLMKTRLHSDVKDIDTNMSLINRNRKMEQTAAGKKLETLDMQYKKLISEHQALGKRKLELNEASRKMRKIINDNNLLEFS